MSKGREEIAAALAEDGVTVEGVSVEACLTALQELVVWEDGRWMCGEADVTDVVGGLLPCPETDRERAERLARNLRTAEADTEFYRAQCEEVKALLGERIAARCTEQDRLLDNAGAEIRNQRLRIAELQERLQQTVTMMKDRDEMVEKAEKAMADAHAVIDQRNKWIATQDAIIKELRSDVENMRIALGVPVEPVDAPHRMFTGESDYSPDGRPGVPCGSEG